MAAIIIPVIMNIVFALLLLLLSPPLLPLPLPLILNGLWLLGSVRDELYELRLYFESTGFHWDGLSFNVLSLTSSSCLSTPEKLHGSKKRP